MSPQDFRNYIWIPHQLVFKTDLAATTKNYLLNKAAYSGVNLTDNILDLLLPFRPNNYILLADI